MPDPMHGFSCGHFLMLAKNAHDSPGPYNHGYRASVILCGVAFELFLSELEGLAATLATRGDKIADTLHSVLKEAERERLKVLFKLSLAHLVLTGELPDKGAQPYQDLPLLMLIRNALVHEKYGKARKSDFEQAPAVVKAAVQRGLLPRLDNYNHAAFTTYLSQPHIAKWAHGTVVDTLHWFSRIAPGSLSAPFRLIADFVPKIS